MALSGLCDTVLYALARKNSVLDSEGPRDTSDDSHELTSGGLTFDDDPVSTVRVSTQRSNPTDLNVPNADVEHVT